MLNSQPLLTTAWRCLFVVVGLWVFLVSWSYEIKWTLKYEAAENMVGNAPPPPLGPNMGLESNVKLIDFQDDLGGVFLISQFLIAVCSRHTSNQK